MKALNVGVPGKIASTKTSFFKLAGYITANANATVIPMSWPTK